MKRFRITADTVNGMNIIPLIRGFPKYFLNLEISFQICKQRLSEIFNKSDKQHLLRTIKTLQINLENLRKL
jgi:hypothetical protein